MLVVLGLLAYARLPLRESTNIDPPIVSVEVTDPGASAAVVETRITQPLEDALAGIEGVETIQSQSRNGRASITLEFSLQRDIEGAANVVRDAVGRVADRLPREADPPQVAKIAADADLILWLNLSAPGQEPLALTDVRSATSSIVCPVSVALPRSGSAAVRDMRCESCWMATRLVRVV